MSHCKVLFKLNTFVLKLAATSAFFPPIVLFIKPQPLRYIVPVKSVAAHGTLRLSDALI